MADEKSVFRFDAPLSEDIDGFHRDGYIAYPGVLTDEALEGLTGEILNLEPVRDFINLSDVERQKMGRPSYFVRPWNDRGYWGDRLIDAPLVTALLQATVGPDYHFCHSALRITARGANPIRLHQDHHHWFHEYPVNFAEREKYYIQILYYPNGFRKGDHNLIVVPGSHKVSPKKEMTREMLLSGKYDKEASRELKEKHLEVPPGSMVYINARMYHGVEAKPLYSPQAYRIFNIDIFKEAGPPHRYTQEIPPQWISAASPERKKLFEREHYTEKSWIP